MLFWLTFIQTLPTLSIDPVAIDPVAIEAVNLFHAEIPSPIAAQMMPISRQPVVGQLSPLLVFPGIAGGLVFLLLLSVWAYTRVYVITPNNEAFVRTGGVFAKGKTVILNGGCVVLPGFHELTRVPLREISIDVERTGKLAVRTQDYLRADMRVTFYVCISASEGDVLTAAARLSQGNKITPDDIKNALEKRADDAIRAAAKTKSLAEIDSDKLGFAQEVLNLVQQDLGKVGLTLNNIAISEIQESDTYDTNNFFDVQGVRLRTETIQRSIQQKREVELTTQVAIEQKELDAQKRSLQIIQEKEAAKLEQQLQIETLKARREREIQEAKSQETALTERTRILQEKAVEEEEIRRKLGIQQSQIDADIELEERNKLLKVAQALQQQQSEIAEISRQRMVEASRLDAQVQIADSEKLARIAQEDVAIALANKRKESFQAEAQRAKAEAGVLTATEVEGAERKRQLSAIAAQREAEERRIEDQNVVEIDVYRRRRQAEIAKEAALLEAEAIRTLADANRDGAIAQAEGLQAQIAAKNALENSKMLADTFLTLWPELAEKLPEILQALAPQPGVIGDARVYAFPGANGSGTSDISKLLMSTSGLALINTLLDEGKLGALVGQIGQLLHPKPTAETSADLSVAHPESSIDRSVALLD
ncbi:MAG: flotillin family protein [Leptolyngbyaceae cyanobacterium CSU_1_4]|nr:flotillin family protein [Leptolyngbyaceae cyanobacterium CSU_1_4]